MKESGRCGLLRMYFPWLLGLLGVLTSCGSAEGPVASSSLQFAHVAAQEAAGGILGRLVAEQSGLLETSTTRVCVQPGTHAALSPEETLLEVQLAYATWLTASEHLDELSWSNFVFDLSDNCYEKRFDYESLVIFALENQIVTKGMSGRPFGSARLTCQKTSPNSTSCQNGYFLFGRATAGTAKLEPAGQALSYTQEAPSLLYMSPFVNWQSLSSELKGRVFEDHVVDAVSALLETYAHLLQMDPYQRSLNELYSVIGGLRDLELIAVPDPVEESLYWNFLSSNQTSIDETYRARMASYATLLHEVGHQLGMMHAHSPPDTSIWGESPEATMDRKGRWVTDKASMAYGLPYFFLTDDDVAGLKSNYSGLVGFFSSQGELN